MNPQGFSKSMGTTQRARALDHCSQDVGRRHEGRCCISHLACRNVSAADTPKHPLAIQLMVDDLPGAPVW